MRIIRVIVDEMPKSCNYCKLIISIGQYGVCSATREGIDEWVQRPAWCPLEVETDGWKPVSEKPTKSMYVLICHVGDDYARTAWYSENEGDFYWWGDKQDLDLWRPLPVAPKEVKDE